MIKDEKIHLIICSYSKQSILNEAKENNMEINFAFYGNNSRVLTILRKLWFQCNLPKKHWWFQKNLLNITGKCIVLDADATLPFLQWLSHDGEKKQLIFYYWNIFNNRMISPDVIKQMGYDVWSFDRTDCEKYHIKYNPQLYCQSWYTNISKDNIEYDIAFVGRDKNDRMSQVENLVERFGGKKYKWNIYFTADHWYNMLSNRKYRRFLSLHEMLEEEMKARVILDYSLAYQESVTLRTYDALCNGRKIITNIRSIKKEPFYSKNNVFIIDEDNDNEFDEFMKTDFLCINKDVLEQRNFENWTRRFFEDRERIEN